MKKALIILFLIVFCFGAASASVFSRVSLSEEVAFLKYNRIWTSPVSYYYSVESVASNPTLANDLDIMFTRNIGMTIGSRIGYQWSISDKNRFVSFPQNINISLNSGFAYYSNNFRISLSAILRPSFQTSRNSWISQLGGGLDVSYSFSNGIFLGLGYRYLYNYNMITSGAFISLGYQMGGRK